MAKKSRPSGPPPSPAPAVPETPLSRATRFKAATEQLKKRGAGKIGRDGAAGTSPALPVRMMHAAQDPTGDQTVPPPMPERDAGIGSQNAVGSLFPSSAGTAGHEAKATFWKETIVILLAVLGIAATGYFAQDARLRDISKDFRDGLGEFRRELREDQASLRDDLRDHERRLREIEQRRAQPVPQPVAP